MKAFVLSFILMLSMLDPEGHSLTVKVNGFNNASGQAGIALFNQSKGFPRDITQANRVAFTTITDGAAEITLSDLPSGTYAVAVFHDENLNKVIDRNF